MITAAVWDLPAALFDQVAEGGRLLLPIALAGGARRDCHVAVLRREGDRFRALEAVPGRFVRFTGPGQERGAGRQRLAELPFWPLEQAWAYGEAMAGLGQSITRVRVAAAGGSAPRASVW